MAKIGEGHASAMARQGLRELRSAMYPQSNVASPTEYGMYGTKTPGEVAADREGDKEQDEEKSPSILESRLQQSQERATVMEHDRTIER